MGFKLKGKLGIDVERYEMFVVERTIFIEALECSKEFEIGFAHEFNARLAKHRGE